MRKRLLMLDEAADLRARLEKVARTSPYRRAAEEALRKFALRDRQRAGVEELGKGKPS